MQQAIENFQTELKDKLQYKASSKISPDAFLYKSFKFFDLYNNGYLGKSDFFRTIAKCGVVVDTHDMEKLYDHYDLNGDGNIHYKEFISNLLFSDNQSEENSLQMSESGLHQSGLHQSNKDSETHSVNKIQNSHSGYEQSIKSSNRSQQNSNSSKVNNYLKQSNINRIYTQCETFQQVSNFIKKTFQQNPSTTTPTLTYLLKLAMQLKSTDKQKVHKINKQNLSIVLSDLTEGSINIIMREFNSNQRQQINYAELVYSLKGQIDEQRQEQIDRAFRMLDVRNQREIPIETVIQGFKYGQYKAQFIKGIDLYSQFQGIDDGVFTDEDFTDFIGFLSINFSNNQQFHNFIEKSFFDQDARSTTSSRSNRSREFQHNKEVLKQSRQIQEPTQKPDFRKNKAQLIQQSPSNQFSPKQELHAENDDDQYDEKKCPSRRSERYSEAEKKSNTTEFYIKQVEMIILRMKKRLASKGTKGYLILQKNLKNVDADQDSLITLDELRKVVRNLKIDISVNECNLLFDIFDPEGTNRIGYSEFLYTLKGKMSQNRQQYFQRVWNGIKLNESYSSFSNIKHSLNFRGHPDIQNGRRYDDEIFREIQQTIMLIQELNQTPRNQQIHKKDFHEYFQNLSLSISDDQLFESVLQNFWKMHSKINIEDMYAGSRKTFDPYNPKGYLMDHHRQSVKGGTTTSNAPFGTSSEPTNYFTENGKL